ncbi:gamma-glutamylcyclotransferase family protein [Yoonia sp. 208BN28-4]|uniref:gamma-glutamylcyclotransferase family protein n=1 Tax=Yoonia sp. 208BN28-4 TaxID=3126505 RepID=UPI0030AE9797
MTDPAFFGYGSLVNLATHDYADPQMTTVTGWRRIWRDTTHRQLAILSVTPCPDTTLRGIAATVPNGDWAALDAREAAYQRDQVAGREGLSIYQITQNITAPLSGPYPILLSYLDVVVQGYFRSFGADGVAGFFATTDGWARPILNDRTDPIYPRAQTLDAAETALVDRHIALLPAQVQQAE